MQNMIFILLAVFILYRIYLRVRRNIGWQPLNPGKMQVMTVIFSVIGLLFFLEGAFHPIGLVSDVIGILIGVVLAYYGAAMTRIEQRDGILCYRPNIWIGIIVTVLFLGRLTYRIYEISTLSSLQGGQALKDRLASMSYDVRAPWTSGLILIMFAYYVVYYLIISRKHKRLPLSGSTKYDK